MAEVWPDGGRSTTIVPRSGSLEEDSNQELFRGRLPPAGLGQKHGWTDIQRDGAANQEGAGLPEAVN